MPVAPASVVARARAALVAGALAAVVGVGAVGVLGSGCFAFEGQPHGTKDLTVTPPQLEGSEIVPKLGAAVPLDLVFLDEDGQPTTLRQVIPHNKPTLLILGYWECPMLCSFVLNATKDALAGVDGLEPGTDFQIIAVGIDPTEAAVGSAKLAKAKQQSYTRELARVRQASSSSPKDVPLSSWRFLSAPPVEGITADKHESPQARALAEAVGFGYRWDPQTENYAHGAGIFFVSPPGSVSSTTAGQAILTRTLWGIQFKSSDVRLAIVESGQGLVGTVVDRVLLSCFQFGPEGQYSLYVWGVMRLGGLAMMLAMATLLIALFRREKRREAELDAVLLGQSGAERPAADHQHKTV